MPLPYHSVSREVTDEVTDTHRAEVVRRSCRAARLSECGVKNCYSIIDGFWLVWSGVPAGKQQVRCGIESCCVPGSAELRDLCVTSM